MHIIDDKMTAHVGDNVLPLPGDAARGPVTHGQTAILGVRPENLTLGDAGAVVTHDHSVGLCEPMGSETLIVLDFPGVPLRMRAAGLVKLGQDHTQSVSWDMTGCHLFDPESGAHL